MFNVHRWTSTTVGVRKLSSYSFIPYSLFIYQNNNLLFKHHEAFTGYNVLVYKTPVTLTPAENAHVFLITNKQFIEECKLRLEV